jgi:peptide chain release factor 1
VPLISSSPVRWFERVQEIKKRVQELEQMFSDPKTLKDQSKIQSFSKELARLRPIKDLSEEYDRIGRERVEMESLLKNEPHDEEFSKMYQEEHDALSAKQAEIETKIEDRLLEGSDPNADRNIIVEIRAGTGGEEAALFVRNLFRMYSRFAAANQLKIDVMDTNLAGKGGFKEIIFGVSGNRVYQRFQFESGTHRVQRVPETEANGRIHTSAATVAVLPEATEVEIDLKPEDIRIDICRSGGPGGQGVNTTDSSVQILHIPTGMIVRCQDERSQHKNKAKAFRVLRARLFEREQERQMKLISENRKKQVGSGDRSEKIRTYNYPDRRVTDHRIGLTLHSLHDILEGNLDELFGALLDEDKKRRLMAQSN